jgi:AraC-like DNA-binding protein
MSLYFAVAAALSTPRSASPFCTKMLAGQFQDAAALAAARVEVERSAATPGSEDWQSYADVQLVLGRYEEAEDAYRRSQRALRGHRSETRALLSRNAGWQALFRDHFDTALRAFKRVIDDEAAQLALKLDCLVGATLANFQLGRIDSARGRLETLATLAPQAAERRWCRLADALRDELRAQYTLRAAEALDDHIYWRSAIAEVRPADFCGAAAVLSTPDMLQVAVLARRAECLQQLQGLAAGSPSALAQLERHVRWSVDAKLDNYQRHLRLEIALAALAGRVSGAAESMLYMFRDVPAQGQQHTRWYLEFLYCQAKLREKQGRLQEHAQLYRHYALLSLKHVRADGVSLPIGAVGRPQVVADDISARLPARYRRAYRYVIDHLDQAGLSVTEVAAHIGVTERALQAAFKTHLGVSPSELIRRRRLEHIRDELLDDDVANNSVLSIANRWGLQHRSTLLNSYRKIYHEPPSVTAAR